MMLLGCILRLLRFPGYCRKIGSRDSASRSSPLPFHHIKYSPPPIFPIPLTPKTSSTQHIAIVAMVSSPDSASTITASNDLLTVSLYSLVSILFRNTARRLTAVRICRTVSTSLPLKASTLFLGRVHRYSRRLIIGNSLPRYRRYSMGPS